MVYGKKNEIPELDTLNLKFKFFSLFITHRNRYATNMSLYRKKCATILMERKNFMRHDCPFEVAHGKSIKL